MQKLEVVDQICTTGTGGGQHAVDSPQLGKVFETFFAQACTVAKISETVERLAAFEASHFILSQTQYGVEGQSDRKSTRLNSSHVSISYAVFCLKKKEAQAAGDVGSYERDYALAGVEPENAES